MRERAETAAIVRYAICLAPDVLLLIALLRMVYIGLHAERRWMFLFLCAWLCYSIVALFIGQIAPVTSSGYAMIFLLACGAVWLCGAPELFRAAGQVAQLPRQAAAVLGVLAIAGLASRYAVLNSSLSQLAKYFALNAWIAVIFGATFLLASAGAEKPDALLWRCAGAFFLIFGFGYLLIGALRLGTWSYPALVLLASLAWLALALFTRPTPEHVWNHGKLALARSAYFAPLHAKKGVARG